ncbi:MAG: FkbM family methyltransferase [Byssovorax sp.]
MNVLESVRSGATSVWSTLTFLRKHPLASRHLPATLGRWIGWQVHQRLVPGEVVVPFGGRAKLIVYPGSHAATGNLYVGLHEFEEMGLLLHLLRPGDLFVDVGANIGAYTVLASAVCGATTIAVEPVPETFARLLENLRVNDVLDRVTPENIGLSSSEGVLVFTTGLDAANHALLPGESFGGATIEVKVKTLDALCIPRVPELVKIDVEGLEVELLKGAPATLASPALLAVILELGSSTTPEGRADKLCYDRMEAIGFLPYWYDPFARKLTPTHRGGSPSGNAIFIRDLAAVEARLRAAPVREIVGVPV